MDVDSATWAALALTLTLIGGALTVVAWRRRGPAAGVRGLAWTLVPVAAWLTGTLRLATEVVEAVVDWAARLVFSPAVWLGIVIAVVAAVLFVVSGMMRARGVGGASPRQEREVGQSKRRAVAPPADDDDDMADIEAILKKHGI
jgi:hypothetical protein